MSPNTEEPAGNWLFCDCGPTLINSLCLPALFQTHSAVTTVTLVSRQTAVYAWQPVLGLLSVLHSGNCLLCLADSGHNVCPLPLCIDSCCQVLHCSLVSSCVGPSILSFLLPFLTLSTCLSPLYIPPSFVT